MTMTESDFRNNWPASRKDQFSWAGLGVLFDIMEEYEDATGEEIDFDPIALCCGYSEYPSAKEACEDYGIEPDRDDMDDYEYEEECLDELQLHTACRAFDGGVIVQQF